MAAHQVEDERKYDVDADAVLVGLGDLPGVSAVAPTEEHDLEATYFDTSDLDLARAGITVRRRTGGEDAGWHLKLPTTAARREIQAPLGRSTATVPKRLRTLVLGFTRGRALSVVATVRTHRAVHRLVDSQGRVLAEVADDHVTGSDTNEATAKVWREWEVELVDGDQQTLRDAARLLRRSGARPSQWPSKLARTLDGRMEPVTAAPLPPPSRTSPARLVVQGRIEEQVERLRRLDPLVRADAPDALHDIRVAIRRLRAALATYRPLLDREVTDPLRRELKWLGNELSPPRDAEVIQARLRAMLADEEPEVLRGDARTRADRESRREYRRARAQALEALESDRYLTLLHRLDALAKAPPWADGADEIVDDVLPARVRHDWKRLRRRVSEAGRTQDPTERARLLHGVRKAAKRARYAAEPLVPVYGKPAKRFVSATKRIQSILGDHHDSVTSREWLRRLADAAAADGANSFAFGVLHAREEANAAQRDAEFEAAWRTATRKKSLRLIR